MSMSSDHELPAVIDELLMLISESARYHAHEQVKTILKEAQSTLLLYRKRVALGSRRHVVAVVGLTNVGKSTLLNAILGSELAPRRNGPCTAAPIEFSHGPDLEITVHYHQSLNRPHWQCADVEALHHRLAALADDAGAEASRQIQRVIVQAPLPLLENGLVIADTPGFGAAQTEEATGSHEAALKSYLQDQVSQVFWVVLADQGIGQREKSFHDSFFAQICDDVVATGCEDWENQDRERFRRRFADLFGTHLPRFHFVSGLQGIQARAANDAAGLESAGITLLEERIRELADGGGRTSALKEGLEQLAADLCFWLGEFRDSRQRKLDQFWRPDSWSRWRACLPGNRWKEQVSKALEEHP